MLGDKRGFRVTGRRWLIPMGAHLCGAVSVSVSPSAERETGGWAQFEGRVFAIPPPAVRSHSFPGRKRQL